MAAVERGTFTDRLRPPRGAAATLARGTPLVETPLVRVAGVEIRYLTLPDDRPKSWLEQTCFYSELLFTCYIHAPEDHPHREQYFAKGKALMEDAQSRWPGSYRTTKTLIMCFANTGAFFRALDMQAQKGR